MHSWLNYKQMKFFTVLIVFLFQIHGVLAQSYEYQFQKRCDTLIKHIADYYPRGNSGKRPPGYSGKLADFGKYMYPKIIAIYTKYGANAVEANSVNQKLEIYKTKPTFHFNLVGLPRILFQYSETEIIKKTELDFVKRVWERTDSYNAWTAEGTENHVNMSRTSGYLYAQIATEKYKEQFAGAPLKLKQMKDWIMYWSKKIYETGTGEFNSAIYETYNIIGWLNLYDFAKDKDVKKAAHAVLDYYACEMALHYSQAMHGGSDLRGKGCTESFDGATAYLGWLWFGDSPMPMTAKNIDKGYTNNSVIQSIHAATSKYRPPKLAVKLANKKLTIPAMYYNSKPGYLLESPSLIKQTLYVDSSYMLGAGYFPYGGWSAGDYQIIDWKLICRTNKKNGGSAQYIGGIGMQSPDNKHYESGNQRSPFDQLVHHKNVLIQFTKVPENATDIKKEMRKMYKDWEKLWLQDFKKRFPNDKHKQRHNPVHFQNLDVTKNQSFIVLTNKGNRSYSHHDSILFIELEKNYVAIRSIRGDLLSDVNETTTGNMHFTSVTAEKAKICGFVLEVVNKQAFTNKNEFMQAIYQKTAMDNNMLDSHNTLKYKNLYGDIIQAAYTDSGAFTEPIFDWGFGPVAPMIIHKSPPFMQPEWPKGKGHGKIAKWTVNGREVKLSVDWAVYEGPNFSVKNSILELIDNHGNNYQVNYSGGIPVFNP